MQSNARSRASAVFLLACTARSPSDWTEHRGLLRDLDEPSWRYIANIGYTHGLTGLIARSFEWAEQSLSISIPIARELAERRRNNLVQLLARRSAARLALEALELQGIRFVLFKGLALAEEVYGDLSLREFGDFDILVPPEQAEAAEAVLKTVGYRRGKFGGVSEFRARGHHAAPLMNKNGRSIDLHWELTGSEFRPEKSDLIWQHTCLPATTGALPGLRFTPELNLIYLATHFYWHGFATFKAMLDAYMTVRSADGALDFDHTVALASKLDRLEIVQLTARLCERDFSSLPFMARLKALPGAFHMKLAERLLTRSRLLSLDGGHHTPNPIFRLALSGNRKTMMAGLRLNFLPNKDELAGRFGKPFSASMYPAYYLRQIFRVVTGSKKAFAEFD